VLSAHESKLCELRNKCSPQQRDALDMVSAYDEADKQLLGIVAGEAGVGKSFFLQAALLMLQLRRGPRCAAVVAQSNMAAN
jgi:ABC-type dipeptide/oligopeptide/nickel transport system ATPase component